MPYLISPIEIGLVPNSYEQGQFKLLLVGLIRYSWCHISGPHESIYVKFGVLGFYHVLLKYGHENAKM